MVEIKAHAKRNLPSWPNVARIGPILAIKRAWVIIWKRIRFLKTGGINLVQKALIGKIVGSFAVGGKAGLVKV